MKEDIFLIRLFFVFLHHLSYQLKQLALKEYEASVKSVEEPVQAKTKARTQNREKVQTREASAVKRTTRATTRKEPTVKIVDDDEREM